MKKNRVLIPFVLLLSSIGCYLSVIYDGSTRLVEFVSILVIGILTGILLIQIITTIRASKKLRQ